MQPGTRYGNETDMQPGTRYGNETAMQPGTRLIHDYLLCSYNIIALIPLVLGDVKRTDAAFKWFISVL